MSTGSPNTQRVLAALANQVTTTPLMFPALSFEQGNQLIRQHAKQERRKYSAAPSPITGFAELSE